MSSPLYYKGAILNVALNLALFTALASAGVITAESVIMVVISVVIYLFCRHVKNIL